MVHEHPKMKKAVSDITNTIQLLTTAMSQQEEKRQLKKSKKSKREKAASISGGRKVSAQSIIPDVEVDRNGIPALGHDGSDEDNGSIPNVMDDVPTNSRADWIVSPDFSVSEADGIPPVDGSVPVPIAGSCDIEVEI